MRASIAATALASLIGGLPAASIAGQHFVALPRIGDEPIAPRVIYVENPRFPRVAADDLHKVLQAGASLVERHFGITVVVPDRIAVRNIDAVFAGLPGYARPKLKALVGDFRNGRVDWEAVRRQLAEQIGSEREPLARQIEFARPYLSYRLPKEDIGSFSRAVADTFRARLAHWTVARLDDGFPVIGAVPGRPDLPLNEYLYWSLMAKRGIDAEIILTNQLVASVEYIATPVHSSIRGGITGGATEYNPASRFGSSVWVSLFPYLSDDPQIRALRNGDSYTRDEAMTYAGAMLAHEMGHQLLHLAHPWSNRACVMRPAPVLDFAAWVGRFDAAQCHVGSSPAMTPGAQKVPVW